MEEERAEAPPSGDARAAQPVETESLSEAALDPGRDLSIAFSVGEALGEGGMGRVLQAEDPRLGRAVAVKVMRPALLRDPILRRRFVIEAQVGAQLEHPNIVPIYGMEQAEGVPAFTMRLLPGHDLAHLIARRRAAVEAGEKDEGPGDLHERLEIFLRVCDAVAYANERGVIHRDLKPDNVMLGAHREVYVVDWGVAKVVGVPDLPALEPSAPAPGEPHDSGVHVSEEAGTRHGASLGTLVYMPPEQIGGDPEEHTSASDQFALGMMLQELVTLQAPRRAPTQLALMAEALEAVREACVRVDGAEVPEALRAIIDRATAKEPGARYPSIAALAEDVRRFQLGEPVSVHGEGLVQRTWRQLSKHPVLSLGVVFALLLLGAGVSLRSVRRTLDTEREARARTEALERMNAAVLERSHGVDAMLADVAMLVEGLGAATETLLQDVPTPEPNPAETEAAETDAAALAGAHPFGAAGRLVGRGPALPDLREHPRYGMPVTFATASYLYPEGVDEDAMAALMHRLGPLLPRLRETLLRSGGPGPWSRAEAERVLREERPPLHVSYVSFESGLLVNYPGYEPFPETYDHRRRPWYVAVGERRGPFFGAPYPDASGSAILVPCDRAIHDAEGRFIGVAGADMAMNDVIAGLTVDSLEGWYRGALANPRGELVVDTEYQDLRMGVGLHGDRAFAGTVLPDDLREAIAARGSGWVERPDAWVFFDSLREIDWTFLAWVRR